MISNNENQRRQTGETYPDAFLGSIEAAELDAAHQAKLEADAPTIVEALEVWSQWYEEQPPVNITEIAAIDLKLADAFRMLCYLRNRAAQLAWIERRVYEPGFILPPNDNVYRTVLIRWWLDLFHAQFETAA